MLWMGLSISYLLAPDIARSNEGISTFGIYARTILPYALGFLMFSCFTFAAVYTIEYRDINAAVLARALLVLVLLLLGVLLTPYSVNAWLDWSHTVIAGTLFMCQLVLAAWFLQLHPDAIGWLLFASQCLGSVLAALSLVHIFDYMLIGQIIAQSAFWMQLDKVVPYILVTRSQ
jgi:hypothetical protein